MKVVLLDTGRGRNVASVDLWRTQLELEEGDELALISWNHPKLALPVVDQLVFGPTLQWNRPEPARPNVTLPRRRAGRYRSSAADLPRTDPRRLATSLAVRLRGADLAAVKRLAPVTDKILGPGGHPVNLLSGSTTLGAKVRERAGVTSDGVATDFALAVAHSNQAAELAAWADLIVPFDVRSRKAAWVLAKRVPGPAVPVDMNAAVRIVRAHHAQRASDKGAGTSA